jgi:hypothetical protein
MPENSRAPELLPPGADADASRPQDQPRDGTDASGDAPGATTRRRSRTILWSVVAIFAILLLAAVWVGVRAMIAQQALQDAQAQLAGFRDAVGTGASTAELFERLDEKTSTAAASVGDPVWLAAEFTPALGNDLRAFRQVAQLVDRFVDDGIGPLAGAADGLSFDQLKPVDGRIDIAPLAKLAPAVAKLDAAATEAAASAADIDTSDTVPQIAGAVERVSGLLAQVQPVIGDVAELMPHLHTMLGGDGKRTYLLMFQNNAEERASGGNPAALALLEVDDGAIELVQQASSADFTRPYPEPVLELGGDWDKLFGAHASTWITNITDTPDFPTTARLAQRMWEIEFGRTVDGVVSLDPVALGYLLKATGPIDLETGERLTDENAASFLLNDVYKKYPDGPVQDVVFASAAATIFETLTSGAGDPKEYLQQLGPIIDEQRLLVWSADEDEQRALLATPVGNMLPADNADTTTLGVYNIDDATSKMSYYMDATIDVEAERCNAADPRFTVSTTVTNTLDAETAQTLPQYILANKRGFGVGEDRQWVLFYGPVGASLVGAEIDGEQVVFGDNLAPSLNTVREATGADDRRPAVSGTMDGRPVAIVSVRIQLESSRTITAVFTGGEDATTPLTVSHTPKVRDTPVSIVEASCD